MEYILLWKKKMLSSTVHLWHTARWMDFIYVRLCFFVIVIILCVSVGSIMYIWFFPRSNISVIGSNTQTKAFFSSCRHEKQIDHPQTVASEYAEAIHGCLKENRVYRVSSPGEMFIEEGQLLEYEKENENLSITIFLLFLYIFCKGVALFHLVKKQRLLCFFTMWNNFFKCY